MVAMTGSPKVEPLDDSSWEENSQMAPTPNHLKDIPPISPRTPLLGGDAKPRIDFTGLKLGRPFKGNLKRSQEKVHVSEGKGTQEASQHDGASAIASLTGRKSIKWLDNHGEDLIQVKEFEASDREESDDDEPSSDFCTCVIQ